MTTNDYPKLVLSDCHFVVMAVNKKLQGFQIYISDEMPGPGASPDLVPGSQLCYTHTDPITAGGETYTVGCDHVGSVVSIMLPRTEHFHICEVEVYGMFSKL